MAGPTYAMASRMDPRAVFYRYNIEVEILHSGREVALRYKDHVRKVDRDMFEDCLRDDNRAAYLAEMMHREWDAQEARKYQSMVPPIGYKESRGGWDNGIPFVKPEKPAAPPKKEPSKLILLLEDV